MKYIYETWNHAVSTLKTNWHTFFVNGWILHSNDYALDVLLFIGSYVIGTGTIIRFLGAIEAAMMNIGEQVA